MKKCSKCGEVKSETEFYKDKRTKDGLCCSCKSCHNKRAIKWQKDNPEKVRKYVKIYYKNNSEKVREKRKRYYKDNPEKIIERTKKWQKDNPEKVRKYKSKSYYNTKDKNIEKYRKRGRDRYEKIKNNKFYRINNNMRRGIKRCLIYKKNGKHWEDLAGYTKEELKAHLESKFEDWMNWDNWGKYEKGKLKWQIDHIKPISLFSFTSTEDPEFRECWALSNLQPLEARENMIKYNKYQVKIK